MNNLLLKITKRFSDYAKFITLRRKRVFLKLSTKTRGTIFEGDNRVGSKTTIVESFLGKGTYIGERCIFSQVKLGRFCAIGNEVMIDIGQHPTSTFVSIHPAFYSPKNRSLVGFKSIFSDKTLFNENPSTDSGYYLEVGNDVWICNGVRLKQGIKVGDGAIIAAGAVVTKNVQPYTIVGGNPAVEIKKRFNETQINKLLKLKWWEKKDDWLKDHSELFQNVEGFLESISDDK